MKIELIKTITSIENKNLIKKVKDLIDKEQNQISEESLPSTAYQYIVLKFIITDLNGNRTVIDKAVSEILSTNYDTSIESNSSYSKKIELIVNFLKVNHIFKTIEESQDVKTVHDEEVSPVGIPFLIFKFIPDDRVDKILIEEAFKTFLDYINPFEESFKIRYYLHKRNRINSSGNIKSRAYDSIYTFFRVIGMILFIISIYASIFILFNS